MKVIQRHGNSKPEAKDLDFFQLGYDNSNNEYGEHKGKTLFIKDGDGEIRDITQSYLKEEFVNYAFPTSGEENEPTFSTDVSSDGTVTVIKAKNTKNPIYHEFQNTEYIDDDGDIAHGLVEDLRFNKASDIIDNAGKTVGSLININAWTVNPKKKYYVSPENNNINIFSVDPAYLADLVNELHHGQKAIITVETLADLNERAQQMANNDELTAGTQFFVKHDEFHNNDTYLYMVSDATEIPEDYVNPFNEMSDPNNYAIVDEDDDNDDDNEITYDNDDKTITLYFKKSHTEGEVDPSQPIPEDPIYAITSVMALEYTYHDPNAVVDADGYGLVVDNKNERENTIDIGLNTQTLNAIKSSFKTVDNNFGTSGVNQTISFYGVNSGEASVVDFKDFILDEGSWD